MYAEGPWTYSKQEGTPGHCFQAQVWGANGHSLAVVEPTADEAVASDTARLMAASGELLEALVVLENAARNPIDPGLLGYACKLARDAIAKAKP